VLAKGDYVRLKMAPATRMGTIENIKIERSKLRYQFRQDCRFREALPGVIFETWVPESVLEPCEPPCDDYVRALNELIQRSGSRCGELGGLRDQKSAWRGYGPAKSSASGKKPTVKKGLDELA
jgi:hypothetical protein